MRFKDKTVIITGGSGGIGRQMVEAFAREGALVINLDKVPSESPPQTNVKYRACDLTDISDIAAAVTSIKLSGRHTRQQCVLFGEGCVI